MIIAVSEVNNNPEYNRRQKKPVDEMIAEFGSRMWTFPEVLLSPGRSVDVWVSGRDGEIRGSVTVPKNQFAHRAWKQDQNEARHLVDHYLGSINLSRLELSILALKCLYNRATTEMLPGDHSYALMGLLRQRPQIDKTDTAFQAFARYVAAGRRKFPRHQREGRDTYTHTHTRRARERATANTMLLSPVYPWPTTRITLSSATSARSQRRRRSHGLT